MNHKLLGTAFLFTTLFINAQNVEIPNEKFKTYLLNNLEINTNNDTEIQLSEASDFTGTIDISAEEIYNITGIEAFINIKELYCNDNGISSFDLSKNTALEILDCSSNPLIAIDLSKNINLKKLDCVQCSLTSLDVSKNVDLTFLDCDINYIKSLDLSKNISLTEVHCLKNTDLKIICVNPLHQTDTWLKEQDAEWSTDCTITDINDLTKSTKKTIVMVVDLQGKVINEDYKGLSIIVYSDGSRAKVLVE